MSARFWFLALAVAVPLGVAGTDPVSADTRAAPARVERPAGGESVSLVALKTPTLESARAQALTWLTETGKTDPASLKQFEDIWTAASERPILERVAGTLALGNPEAGKLLNAARDPAAPPPLEAPALLKDPKASTFFRANLGLAYAKALIARRVHEEALDVLRAIKPSLVVDPAAYFFHRAVAEHALALRAEADRSIFAVNEDVADAPNRYRELSLLMLFDMQTWREKDLGKISRLMDNIERRLELSRGGPKTQKIQKEVVARLDEMIKQIENQNNRNNSGES